MDEPVVETWSDAITVTRSLPTGDGVCVPKATEPTLPAALPLRPSNFPWSIHKGATAVYREDAAGRHLQIREYPRHWRVTVDAYNPHVRPLEHAAVDVPLYTLLALTALTPIRGYRWVAGDGLPSPAGTVAFSLATLGKPLRFGRALLGV